MRAARAARRGQALGVDLSAPMLTEARRLASRDGVDNAAFEQADAQTCKFPAATFDVAISCFGLMFFGDPRAAFANIAEALRPGGRLAFTCWQDVAGNQWLTVPLAAVAAHVTMPGLPASGEPGPFSLADPQRVRGLLTGAGFDGIGVEALEEPRWIGEDVDDAMGYYTRMPIARSLLATADEQTTAVTMAALREALRPHQRPEGLILRSAAWLVTARR